jgi:hypothetical protein
MSDTEYERYYYDTEYERYYYDMEYDYDIITIMNMLRYKTMIPVCCFRNNISFLIISIMVTTRSYHVNINQTRDPISVSDDNNPITTQNIIMTATATATAAWTLNLKLNDADVKSFFKDADSMNCVSDEAVAALADEGITIPESLTDFEDDDIDNMSHNLTKLATAICLSAICVNSFPAISVLAHIFY